VSPLLAHWNSHQRPPSRCVFPNASNRMKQHHARRERLGFQPPLVSETGVRLVPVFIAVSEAVVSSVFVPWIFTYLRRLQTCLWASLDSHTPALQYTQVNGAPPDDGPCLVRS
jgi:hypothetical protein